MIPRQNVHRRANLRLKGAILWLVLLVAALVFWTVATRAQLNVSRTLVMGGWCQNATAITGWSLPVTNPAVAACVTGTNTQRGVLDFADGANALSAQTQLLLPADWQSGLDMRLVWFTTAITGAVVWQVQTICVADAETGDPAFNTASTVTDTAQGTTLRHNEAVLTSVITTGCLAGELLFLKLSRDPNHASDTLAATARLVTVEVAIRRGQ